jgi:hypothetical protein
MLTSKDITKPGAMSVSPDQPVPDDKVTIYQEQVLVTKVVTLSGTKAEPAIHRFTQTGRYEHEKYVEFTGVNWIEKWSVGYRSYWTKSAGSFGTFKVYFPHIIYESEVYMTISDREDVMEARDQYTQKLNGRFG